MLQKLRFGSFVHIHVTLLWFWPKLMHTGVTESEVWNHIAYSCYTCEVSIMLHKLRFGILSDSYRGLDPYWCSCYTQLRYWPKMRTEVWIHTTAFMLPKPKVFSILLDNIHNSQFYLTVYFHVTQVKLSLIYKIFHMVKFWSIVCFLLQQLRFKYIMHIHVTQLSLVWSIFYTCRLYQPNLDP